jgi:WD40 repeat protein
LLPALQLKEGLAMSLINGRLVPAVALIAVTWLVPTTAGWPPEPPVATGGKRTNLGVELLSHRGAERPTRTDSYGDPLPDGTVARLGTVRGRAHSTVHSLAFSSDGGLVAIGTDFHGVELFDPTTGHRIRSLESSCANQVVATAHSPDNRLVASAQWKSVFLHEAGTGRLCRRLEAHADRFELVAPDTIAEDRYRLVSLAFSPDGKVLATAANHRFCRHKLTNLEKELLAGVVRLWDPATGRRLREWTAHANGIGAIAFAPDGQTLASTGSDGTLGLWNPATGQPRHEPVKHTDALAMATYSPDGKLLACASRRAVVLYDPATAKRVRTISVPEEWVATVAFSPNGDTMLSASGHSIRLWDPASGRLLREFAALASQVSAAAFAPNGRTLVSGSHEENAVRFWDVSTGRPQHWGEGHTAWIDSLVFSPDSKLLASGSYWDRTVRLWDVATARQVDCLKRAERTELLPRAFAAHGQLLVLGDRRNGKTELWPFASREPPRKLAIDFEDVSADGRFLALADRTNHALTVWDAIAAKGIGRHVWSGGSLHTVRFSPGSKQIALVSDGTVQVWDLATGRPRQLERRANDDPLTPQGVEFSSDGRFLAVGDHDGTIGLWAAASGKELRRFGRLEHKYPVTYARFSPDSRILAAGGGDSTTRLWEVATGRLIRRLDGFFTGFSPDGQLVAVSGGSSISLFETLTGELFRECRGHTAMVDCVTFAPDSRLMATASYDTTVLLWDLTWSGRSGAGLRKSGPASRELPGLWEKLSVPDSGPAYQAVARFVAAGDEAVSIFREHLSAARGLDDPRMRALLADLDSDGFATREAAGRQLADLGLRSEAALRQTLALKPSLEVSRRVESLLDQMERDSPAALSQTRALQVLERLGSRDAEELLRSLAVGPSEARLTHEAKATLKRLAQRPARMPRD